MHTLPDPAFWSGRRVFLTGHTGFKGGWLALWLEHLGARVTGYALKPEDGPSFFAEVHAGRGSLCSRLADIRDRECLARRLSEAAPDIVLHLAAQPLVRLSYDCPVETFDTNVMGTVHVLDAVRQVDSVSGVVVVTSDKCYANQEWLWGYRENEPMGGHDPYSASKGCTELVAASFRDSYFAASGTARSVRLATVRAGNVIGGGDWATDRLVPDILRALSQGAPVILRNPSATRPWQHVLEPLAGYLVLAERLSGQSLERFDEAWNFGPDDNGMRTVGWIADRLCSSWSKQALWQQDAGSQPHEAHLLKLDSAKARSRLGWRPIWTLETALTEIVDWHKRWLDGADMRLASIETIDRFSRAALPGGVSRELADNEAGAGAR